MDEPALPPNWPPLAPRAFMERLQAGFVLTDDEMEQLREDAAKADRLEQEDQAFARAARRYKAQWAEDLQIDELRRKLEEKAHARAAVEERMKRERGDMKQVREQRQRKKEGTRAQVEAEREWQRLKLEQRIALAERRTLVRETIQKALVSQSRSEGHAERVFFTDAKMLGDTPGAGSYDMPAPPSTGTSFAVHPETVVKKIEEPRPGPGSYNPGSRLDVASGRASTFGAALKPKREEAKAEEPGPASYNLKLERKAGGTISKHVVKSAEDIALAQAAYSPGPGAYELAGLAKGKSSTISGRTRNENDLMLAMQARRPGPGAYDLPSARVRGGVMSVTNRNPTSLPAIAPGPGSYNKTPTIAQEREMQKLSKQVVDLVRQRQGQPNSNSAPVGRRRRASGGGAADLASSALYDVAE